jgi:hypothetical protein
VQIFKKLDFWNSYHLIQNKEGDEYNIRFRTQSGQFEYQVILFGLRNSPATFQGNIDDCLWPSVDDFSVCYLDNIQIYLNNLEKYEQRVQKA